MDVYGVSQELSDPPSLETKHPYPAFGYNRRRRKVHMKRVSFAMFCGLLIILATGAVIFPQVNAQTEIATEKLGVTLRLLNTSEYSYRGENGTFCFCKL
jgi:hypothetical protein